MSIARDREREAREDTKGSIRVGMQIRSQDGAGGKLGSGKSSWAANSCQSCNRRQGWDGGSQGDGARWSPLTGEDGRIQLGPAQPDDQGNGPCCLSHCFILALAKEKRVPEQTRSHARRRHAVMVGGREKPARRAAENAWARLVTGSREQGWLAWSSNGQRTS